MELISSVFLHYPKSIDKTIDRKVYDKIRNWLFYRIILRKFYMEEQSIAVAF